MQKHAPKKQTAVEISLRRHLIRIAVAHPEIRACVVPLLRQHARKIEAAGKNIYLVIDHRFQHAGREFPSLAQAKTWVKDNGMPSGGPKNPRWRGPVQPGDGHGNPTGPEMWSSDDTDYFILLLPPGAPPEWSKGKHKVMLKAGCF